MVHKQQSRRSGCHHASLRGTNTGAHPVGCRRSGQPEQPGSCPVLISVTSVLIEGDTTLREIKPQAELVSERRPYWPLTIAGMLGVAAWLAYGVRRWRQRRLIDRRTARQRTLDLLAALSIQNPQTPAEINENCALLASCLRDYLAAVTNTACTDLTTRELARRFKEQEVPPAWSTQAVEVLQVCDGVKFANEELEACLPPGHDFDRTAAWRSNIRHTRSPQSAAQTARNR